ncbi:DUF3310 domain-containing protein [Eupransor demetentiae]|uniref:DUF3310 domain-containing protein n=1 Tax=Eupransor demetentiae TaxID=3109584 RepID=A0ABP0ESD3_9LACO|nr:hypothetical protein R54876_GBNLAHCA_00695 [Lactobacillaceae bacterium LMG 33000]
MNTKLLWDQKVEQKYWTLVGSALVKRLLNMLDITEKKFVLNMSNEQLTKPDRYTGKTGMQVFDVIDEFGLDFYEGNVVKYVTRHKKKNGVEDLKKAKVYLERLIKQYEQKG